MRRYPSLPGLRSALCVLPALLVGVPGSAEEAPYELSEIRVTEAAAPGAIEGTAVDRQTLERRRTTASDTASLLTEVPGVTLNAAGGISSFPASHGLADDRVRILLDGMSPVSSCPNHMNPPLSYLDPAQVGSIRVWAGLTPVSVGGDSIGGTIAVESPPPKFAAPGQESLLEGRVGSSYRSNGDGFRTDAGMTLATSNLSLSYSGAFTTANNYDAGGNFKDFRETGRPGRRLSRDEVGSTGYEVQNHLLGLAARRGSHLVEAKFGYQEIPHQGYPNQRMDMVDDTERRFQLRYLGDFHWGSLEATGYRETVDHYMDFGPDKQFVYGAAPGVVAPGMPMQTDSTNTGARLQASLNLDGADLLRLGGEYQRYRLDDLWPPSPAQLPPGVAFGGMAPDTFFNINDGERDRAALFAEWEAHLNPEWMALVGARYERVHSDAGPVRGYNGVFAGYALSAAAFNARDRERNDDNFDFTALLRDEIDTTRTLEFGYAMKTRSPNLYERYSWSQSSMALIMNNFAGDGNGYLGNPELDPEIAHTLSMTFDWHSADRSRGLKVTPYLTHVDDYVDAERCAGSGAGMMSLCDGPGNATAREQFVNLQYVNESARLYGVDLSGRLPLGSTALGSFGLEGLVNYTRGKNRDTGDDLYNVMPLNARLTLTQQYGDWNNALEVVVVAAKDEVSDVRNEIETSGYYLANLRGSRAWHGVRVDFGIDNLLDRDYDLSTGGAYLGQGATMGINSVPWGIAVPGPGRSLYAGISYAF
ncbi:MAG: TonB-dependent receptor plug domain-containing protein [Pseudomonadota bacterium]